MDLYERELQLEATIVKRGVERYERRRKQQGDENTHVAGKAVAAVCKPLIAWIESVQEPDIRMDAKGRRRGEGRVHASRKLLRQVPADAAAYITLRMMIQGAYEQSPMTVVALQVANMLKEHLEWTRLHETDPGLARQVEAQVQRATSVRHRRAVVRHVVQKYEKEGEEWTTREKALFGAALMKAAASKTKMFNLPVVRDGRKNVRRVELTEAAARRLEKGHELAALRQPMFSPMVVPPLDWTTPFNGGYLRQVYANDEEIDWRPMLIVKSLFHEDRSYIQALEEADMPAVYDAINALQRTAWRVNPGIFRVASEAWASRSTLGGLPPQEHEPLPGKPADFDEIARRAKADPPDEDALAQFQAWKQRAAAVHVRNAKSVSRRLSVAFQLTEAERFVDEEAIYFPHQLDWRGRAYPLPVAMNPQSDDLGRALLHFAEGKPIGEVGAAWLCVHLANTFGYDKVSLDDRLAWVAENREAILDSAMDPLDGKRFWCEADKPWQFLAACFEYLGWTMEGDAYVTHLPVSVDGSCNGLQNFSAMLRDSVGGRATNLVPQEQPADIYQQVADKLAQSVAGLQLQGDPRWAEFWLPRISRKLVKRPVMTLPYGVTLPGMRDQLLQEARKQDMLDGLSQSEQWHAASWLAEQLYEAIGEVVVAARQAMDWLQEVARVAGKQGHALWWTAPNGFPVRQEYRRLKAERVESYIGGMKVTLNISRPLTKLNVRRQTLGIAPNFVHSCDSAHMMATVNLCVENGVDALSMVHDSFGTLAPDVPTLNALLREAFVRQYEDDILEAFLDDLGENLPPEVVADFPPVPERGDLDLEQVRESDYFFA